MKTNITYSAKKKLSTVGLKEHDVSVIFQYGKSVHANKNGSFYYIPKKKIKNNVSFEKFDGVYMLFKGDLLIDVFRSHDFKLYRG